MTEPLIRDLEQGLQALSLSYNADQVRKIRQFIHLLQRWNTVYNLVADSSPDVVLVRHIFDSLSLSPFIRGDRVLDIGSGAGFPGIPLAVFHPFKTFILLDSNGKKTRFLVHAKQVLGLDRVHVEKGRIEHYQSRKPIATVVCRALAPLPQVLEKSGSILASGSRLLAMKGRCPHQEIKALGTNYRLLDVRKLNVPGETSARHLLQVEQVIRKS